MQQVYLLLRNNQQTGPYTLEQLLQLQLKPFDLVWVEGRSAAWQYPGEVSTLKPYVPLTPQADQPYMPVATAVMDLAAETMSSTAVAAPAKKIFVSMPRQAAQQITPKPVAEPAPGQAAAQSAATAQAIPYEHQAYRPSFAPPAHADSSTTGAAKSAAPATALGETRYARSMEEMEESYTSWMYKNKTKQKKNISAKDLGIVAALLALIGGGYYLLSKPALTATHRPAAQAAVTATPVQEQPVTEPTVDPNEASTAVSSPKPDAALSPSRNGTITKTTEHTTNASPSARPVAREHKELPTAVTVQERTTAPNTKTATVETNEGAQDRTAGPPTQEKPQDLQKKKKLRDVFKDIFSGKSKEKNAAAIPASPTEANRSRTAPVTEDPRPAANRQAAHRGEEAPADNGAAQVPVSSLADQVDIFSNAPDDWMMGVSNLKVTLRNRSASALQSASVDVLYYDQNNKLLDRKTIYFNNVPARGRQTLPAPDQKWADHVDYKLQNITAKDDRYARG